MQVIQLSERLEEAEGGAESQVDIPNIYLLILTKVAILNNNHQSIGKDLKGGYIQQAKKRENKNEKDVRESRKIN